MPSTTQTKIPAGKSKGAGNVKKVEGGKGASKSAGKKKVGKGKAPVVKRPAVDYSPALSAYYTQNDIGGFSDLKQKSALQLVAAKQPTAVEREVAIQRSRVYEEMRNRLSPMDSFARLARRDAKKRIAQALFFPARMECPMYAADITRMFARMSPEEFFTIIARDVTLYEEIMAACERMKRNPSVYRQQKKILLDSTLNPDDDTSASMEHELLTLSKIDEDKKIHEMLPSTFQKFRKQHACAQPADPCHMAAKILGQKPAPQEIMIQPIWQHQYSAEMYAKKEAFRELPLRATAEQCSKSFPQPCDKPKLRECAEQDSTLPGEPLLQTSGTGGTNPSTLFITKCGALRVDRKLAGDFVDASANCHTVDITSTMWRSKSNTISEGVPCLSRDSTRDIRSFHPDITISMNQVSASLIPNSRRNIFRTSTISLAPDMTANARTTVPEYKTSRQIFDEKIQGRRASLIANASQNVFRLAS